MVSKLLRASKQLDREVNGSPKLRIWNVNGASSVHTDHAHAMRRVMQRIMRHFDFILISHLGRTQSQSFPIWDWLVRNFSMHRKHVTIKKLVAIGLEEEDAIETLVVIRTARHDCR